MENQFNLSLHGVSKADISTAADSLVSQIVDDGVMDPLQALIRIRAYKQLIENAEKRISNAAIVESDKYAKVGNKFNAYGVELTNRASVKYDFSVCGCKALERAEERVKKIKEALKNASEETPFVDVETGEMYTIPAEKISSETLAVTFK